MDTRKLHEDLVVTIHNDGNPEELTEITVGEAGGQTVGYMDPDMAEELVKRWNAYLEHLELLAAIRLKLAADHATNQSGSLQRLLLKLHAMPELDREHSTGRLRG